MRTFTVAFIALALFAGALADCGCTGEHPCCSKWGFCGNTPAYCDPAQGCREGCWGSNPTSKPKPPTTDKPKPPKPTTDKPKPPTDKPNPPPNTNPPPTRKPNNNKYQLAAYWGQDTIGLHDPQNLQKNIDYYCDDDTYDILVVSFLITFFGRQTVDGTPLPEINLANSCEKSFDQYPYLLNCPDVAEGIKKCQAKGKKIVLSLGGAAGTYGFTAPDQPAKFAQTLWDMFLGGSSSLPRPFGDAVFDGVDLDIEGGNTQYYDTFVKILKEKYFNTHNSTRQYYITGAPQCPFPDAYIASALETGYFDYVFVQFYNNYCGLASWQNPNAWNWKSWEDFAGRHSHTKIFVGAPAATYAANNGYVDANTLGQVINSVKSSPAFGGIMLWDATVSKENGFGAAAAALIH